MSRKKKILIGFGVVLLLLQFIRIDKSRPSSNPEDDFLTSERIPEETKMLFKNACYDCHSYESTYPWYSNIAPISLFLGGHIKGGRQSVNFSNWNTYKASKKEHYLNEIIEMLETKRMPMKSYIFMHKEANLSDADRKMMMDWVKTRLN